MRGALLVLFLVSRASAGRRSVQQSVFVSRKSGSGSAPVAAGYMYNQVDNRPGTLAMFGNDANDYNTHSLGHYSDYSYSDPPKYNSFRNKKSAPKSYSTQNSLPSYEYLKAKAEAKYESNFLPSKARSDAMYEKLKTLMHYKPSDESSIPDSYDALADYHVDENDVRTGSRTSYDGWPYLYHSPYEYESMMKNADTEKAKDKRFVVEPVREDIPVREVIPIREVIPVHEDHADSIPHYYNSQTATTKYNRVATTDNPMYGDQPFFSFVLNDYFDKNDDDSLVFKGLDWGKEFDNEPNLPDVDDYLKRNRRVGNNGNGYDNISNGYDNINRKTTQGYDSFHSADSTTEKGYDKSHEFDKHEKGDEQKEGHKSAYEKSGNNYRGFKDFIDTFANRFGGEEHKKDAKYVLRKNQDKGEKKKGFRRVYHKDEYQEEDEFYDNSNSSAKAEEKGGSSAHQGGSEAVLKSHATAAIGNEASAFNNAGNAEKNKYENNHKGNERNKGFGSEFNRYIDVAKKAALSNSADYVDNNFKQ